MAKHGKNYLEARDKVGSSQLLVPEEAVSKVKEAAYAGFDETVELAVRLSVDPRHADQIVRGAVVLPHGTGQEVRVLVFAKGEKATEATEAGADFVGADEYAEKIQNGWLDFDVAVATPDMMSVVGRLGRVLGPRGLMPNPKSGTVTFDLDQAIREIKAGKVEYRTDRNGNIHLPIGRISFDHEALVENFRTVIDALVSARPAAAKGQYMRSVTLSSTMGPGVKVNPALAQAES